MMTMMMMMMMMMNPQGHNGASVGKPRRRGGGKAVLALLLLLLWLDRSPQTTTCDAFAFNTARNNAMSKSKIRQGSSSSRLFNTNGEQEKEQEQEPDLFEYFDPLLSPHAYPNGISPDQTPLQPVVDDASFPTMKQAKPQFGNPFGIDYLSQKKGQEAAAKVETDTDTDTTAAAAPSKNNDDEDLFDFFDPLLSPHAYPNGISPTTSSSSNMKKQESAPPQPLEVVDVVEEEEEDDRYNPLRFKSLLGVPVGGSSSSSSASSSKKKKKKKKIGILLMDHGSRNPASNARLHRLAELYQLTIAGENAGVGGNNAEEEEEEEEEESHEIVVLGAHMEIATPSIPDQLKALVRDHGVEEIVCHPYFLSPGRHVTEDIPQIVQQAIVDLAIPKHIPVITTDPVGSNTQLMIGAIHSLVRENSQVLRERKKKNV